MVNTSIHLCTFVQNCRLYNKNEPYVKYELWMIMMCENYTQTRSLRFILGKTYTTLVSDVDNDNQGEDMLVWWQKVYKKFLFIPSNIIINLKLLQKMILKKEDKIFLNFKPVITQPRFANIFILVVVLNTGF